MKIFILKLLSLLVLLLGLVSLGIALGVPEVKAYLDQVPGLLVELQGKLPPQVEFLKGALTVQALWFGGSVAAIVLGIYGFFPQFAKYRRKKKIAYEGPHGEVQIQLDSVEQSLNHVLARMPEIKRINLRVDPLDGGRRALIRADVVLNQQPGQNARAIAALVSDYIAETSTKLLGLEELAKIDLNVVGINVNTRKSSKAIRKESLSHSANAPVELLEAAPKPLTLSGPGEPIGSEPIEEEIEEEAEGALDTSAVDTRQYEANQAAARSELLEPLSMGGHSSTTAPADEDAGAGARETRAEAQHPNPGVAPHHMDVLDESLDDSAEPDGDDDPDAVIEDDVEDAGFEEEEADELEEDGEEVSEEEETSPFETADVAEPGSPAAEPAAVTESVNYPWETGNSTQESMIDDSATAEVPDTAADHDAADSTDTMAGDMPGEVTIPDSLPEETPAPEAEKKRWGSWFN
jgi:hypothetical protein